MRYILTSELRLNLILSLYKTRKNLEELRNELDKKSTNISRGLKELKEKNLIEKSEKYYSLTSTGFLVCINIYNLINNWCAVENTYDFWQKHSIDSFPLKFLNKMTIWKKAELIQADNVDFAKPLTEYIKYLSKSKNLKIILPVFSKIHFDAILDSLIKNDGTLELITTEAILKVLYNSDSEGIFSSLVNSGKINLFVTEEVVETFLTSADNFASLYLFFDNKCYDDSAMLLIKDEESISRVSMFFNNYKNLLIK